MGRESDLPSDKLEAILATVAAHRGVDFRDHRRETILRGVGTRLDATGAADVDAYQRILAESSAEVHRLAEALVVPFTCFFRDAPVFDALESRVIPDLANRATATARAWAVGVATGEEAWSLAMTFMRAAERHGVPEFEVIASDVDQRSLEIASEGCYPDAARHAIGADAIARFFEWRGQSHRVVDALRRHVHFARHDIMGPQLAPRHAVIASFQLVLFRNVQIYFERRLQQKAIERLHSVLTPGGVLVLGATELIPDAMRDAFENYPGLDHRLRVYRRRET